MQKRQHHVKKKNERTYIYSADCIECLVEIIGTFLQIFIYNIPSGTFDKWNLYKPNKQNQCTSQPNFIFLP